MSVQIKAAWELAIMRDSGRMLARVAAEIEELIRPGVTTRELDELAARRIQEMGAQSNFKGYVVDKTPFPATICASPNDQVVHGIPNDTPLVEGDIISVDFGLVHRGYHADMAFTKAVGKVSDKARKLLDVTHEALHLGTAQAMPGNRVGDIGFAIESHVAPHKLGIVRQYVGHGIGRALHERPSVPNYGKKNTGDLIKVGMCLAIEPMVTLGTWRTRTLNDRWTVVTKDGSLSAHFEHTIAITPDGPEVLTRLDS